ncbi:peptide/nickel transport system permease protein [Haloarcula quadrata]|uniref:Peptide/nickel transport system permease protein n=1 Tax=Haloarcula quadrata TaxID=182779 RepID=A0A495RA53_9EURY|nr:ABC transporter permease [Haloarcula quadrata]RKS84020.1 peptide/nickel transport system permease protein [Haloarcula quadrata]
MSRATYMLKRLVLSIPVIIFGTTVTFAIIRLGPLSPAAAILGPQGDARAIRQIEQRLGLNEPLWEQYFEFMGDLFLFDLGQSWVVNSGTPAIDLIISYAPRTIWLGFWAVLIALGIGIPLGFYAGLNPNTFSDYFASFGGIVWRAMPNFWLAVILVTVLSQTEQLFGFSWTSFIVETNVVTSPNLAVLKNPTRLMTDPGQAWTNLAKATKQILPPALVLGSASMGTEMRIGRTAVLETINSKYVETAKAKGVSPRVLVWKHIFRNALIPLVPVITAEAFILIGGSVLVETVFSINGIGLLFFRAAEQGDLPLVGTLMYLFILLIVGLNIVQDFAYTIIDPRVGYDA